MKLLVDIGNARFKWCVLEEDSLGLVNRAKHAGNFQSVFGVFSESLPEQLDQIVVANVAGETIGRQLAEFTTERFGRTPDFVATAAEQGGVSCAYDEPNKLGVDRWVAIIAAHSLNRGGSASVPICVIDAGTAVTIDVVSAAGQHLGGLIMAGPRLVTEMLHGGTSAIRTKQMVTGAPDGLKLFGNDTDSAVVNGCWLALSAAADRAIRVVTEKLGEPDVYVTGGDGGTLGDWLETEVQFRENLVLEGLAVISRN